MPKQAIKKHGVKFAVVGTITAIIYFLILYLLVELNEWPITLSSSIAYIGSLVFNYLSHYQWTFQSDNPHKIAMTRFLIMNTGGFFINMGIMYYGSMILPEYYLVIQLFAISIIVVWNFILSSFWVYKDCRT